MTKSSKNGVKIFMAKLVGGSNLVNGEVAGTPLLMHNIRLANPMDPHAIALGKISKKRGKTYEDYEAMCRIDFEGGMYWRDGIGPVVPAQNLEKFIQSGAKVKKLGTKVTEAVQCLDSFYPLIYKGPKEIELLYKEKFRDISMQGIGKSKVIRCRPMFEAWAVEFSLVIDVDAINQEEIQYAMEYAGRYKGFMDGRPRNGKCKLVEFKEISAA